AVAYVAGEPHTDSPKCASDVIASFGRAWNDALDDQQRQRLRPYIYRLVGSAGTAEQEMVRSWMAYDWLVRTHTVAWLRLAGLSNHADALAGLPEIVDRSTIDLALPAINAARTAARDAAWDGETATYAAARNVANAAASGAAWAAAWAAAWDASWAATGDAALDTALVAARAAVSDAARDALITRDELIESAHDLMDRMLKVTEA